MPFALVDDVWFCNPKVTQLSKDAKLLYLAGLCYCSRNLTDGVLTKRAVGIIRLEVDAKPRHVEELADLGFWDRMADGYLVHDYDVINQPAEDIRERRKEISKKRREAGKKGAAARWGDGKTRGKTDGNSHGTLPIAQVANAPSLSSPREDQEPFQPPALRSMK